MNSRKNKLAGVGKGAPSAVVLSILIHAALFLLAGTLVVFTVVKKEEQKFEQPKVAERPKMKLKKPKVRVKKTSMPKSTTRIVTKMNRASMPDIQLPEMSGMGEGLGGDFGGFDMMPDLGEISVFGNTQSIGNDFEGVVYSLLYDRKGGTVPMGPDMFREVLRKYVLSGWKDSVLARYYRLPKKLYSTYILVPPIPTAMAPGLFGADGLEDYYLFVKYEGKLVHKEDIRFRFWGIGDAYIFVNVGGEEVLLSTWRPLHAGYFDWWQSSAGGDRTYILGNQRMVVGDWIDLKAGEPVDMKVLFGEWHGGYVSGMLLVEVDGVEYPRGRHNGPLLPIFKTAELSWDSLTEISRFLAEDECSLTNGPVFNDYYSTSALPAVVEADTPESGEEPSAPAAVENAVRQWTLVDGRSVEAEFVTEIAGKAILKNMKGKQIRIPMEQLSETDCSHILLSIAPTLDINFAKTSRQKRFGDTRNAKPPAARANLYTFSAQIKKTSTRPYDFGLSAEFFVVGNEFGGDKRMLLDYQKADFTLAEENDYGFKFSGKPVELIDYHMNSERKGKKYRGFLVVVKDSRGEVIAYKTPSENLYRNLDNLRKLKVGWYFDKQCVRCLPTPPKPFASVGNN
ncbi:MAG: SHD1 domain-containing protein [Verrucomicrobiota bacterium]